MVMTIIRTNKRLRPREENDFYETPEKLAKTALLGLPDSLRPLHVLDPGFGTGIWGKVAREQYTKANIVGMDIISRPSVYHAAYDSRLFGDYLKETIPDDLNSYDLVIGNPPFKHAEAFVRQSYTYLNDGGYMVLLLRLNFLASKTRAKGLWVEWSPYKVSVCAQRPSFTNDGKTDDSEYAIFYWRKFAQAEVHLSVINWINWR